MDRRDAEFGCAVIVIGLLAGVAGGITTVLLHAVEHLTFHYSFGSLLDGVTGSNPMRRALGPTVGGALAGLGWWLLRRRTAVPGLTDAIDAGGPLPRVTLSIDALLQVLLVGSGASLGREGAPRQLAAAMGDLGTSRWSRSALTARDRQILLCCAAGAGLGAVYSVPVGGALFASSILLRTWHPRALGCALITSSLAVAVASPVTHEATPLDWPDPAVTPRLAVLAVLLAPLSVAVGLGFDRLMRLARPARPAPSWTLVPAIAGAGLAIGVCSHWWPQLPGNGKSILTISVDNRLTLGTALALLILKPLLTALFLRAGAVGGMLTPSLATGAALGGACALTVAALTHQPISVPVISLACAAGVLAITQQAPLWAGVFVWELGRPPWWFLAVFLIAAFAAHGTRILLSRSRSNVQP